jgi:hypothetical protein
MFVQYIPLATDNRQNDSELFEVVVSIRFSRSYKGRPHERAQQSPFVGEPLFFIELSWKVILRSSFVTVEQKTLVIQ